jgi:hypothetical protein
LLQIVPKGFQEGTGKISEEAREIRQEKVIVKSFWTILIGFLLAVAPTATPTFGAPQNKPDTCHGCRCCVQPNSSPAPVRSIPASATKSISIERFAEKESSLVFFFPAATKSDGCHFSVSAILRSPDVSLIERYCTLLI